MKQKRKVKSLLPQRKDRKTSFLTTLLLVLSTILCIWSASLLTSSVFAENFTEVTYTWLDDNIEVLYEMKFVDPADLSGWEITKLEISGNSLYISPNPVIVNPDYNNVVASWTYWHILWWSGNKLSSGSENVTIIAWLKNEVKWANATLLWWVKNILWTWNVLVWWSDNKAQNNREWIVIIGWKDILVTLRSYIKDNIFILWGENSKVIRTWNNIILWWSWVNLSVVTAISTNTEMLNNIFAFSNPEEMKPQVWETFYLYLKNWVWIGTWGLPGWLVVHGAMSFGDGSDCNISNTWVVISYSWCLVWCTKSSYLSGKREVLDNSEKCKFLAETDSKLFYQEEEIPETPNYRWYCTYAGFTWHTRACSTPGVYQNVIFETSIVDNGGCASLWSWENKCVFECEKWYHLVYDTRYGWTWCYADCTTADGIKTIKHNESTIWYKKQLVICSDGEKCETCGGKNSATLICDDWVLYISWTHTKAEENGYNYARCTLKWWYKCQSGNYNIENLFQVDPWVNNGQNFTLRHYWKIYQSSNRDYFRTEITFIRDLNKSAQSENTGFSQATSFNRWIITSEWARGYYQLCIDYTSGKNIDIKLNNTDCGKGKNYYKLIRCKSKFTNENGVCRPQCKSFLSWDNNYYNYWKILTWYKEGNVTCPKEDCESSAFRCEDGGERWWIWVAIDGDLMKNANNYKYSYCSIASKKCDQFEFSSEDLERFKNRDLTWYENSIYTGCTIINNNNWNCETWSTYYKLDGCKTNYHTENNEYCIYNYRPAPCSDKVNLPDYAARVQEDSTGRNGITLAPWEYGQSWDEDAWTSDIQPPEACKWKCIDGAKLEWKDKCVINWECSKEEKFECIKWISVNEITWANNEWYYWDCKWYGWTIDNCYLCNDGYTYSWTTHKCEKNVCFGAKSNWVLVVWSDENLEKNTKAQLYPSATAAWNNPCAYTCGNLYYDKWVCSNISSICWDSPRSCHVWIAMNYNSDDKYYKWDCWYDEIIYQNCSVCKNGSPNNETCNACGNELYQCYWNVNPTNFQENENSYTWECDWLPCSKTKESSQQVSLQKWTVYTFEKTNARAGNSVPKCSESTGWWYHNICILPEEICRDNDWYINKCNSSRIVFTWKCQGNGVVGWLWSFLFNDGSFSLWWWTPTPDPLTLCKTKRDSIKDSCKNIDWCYITVDSCRDTKKWYFKAEYNRLQEYYPECDCQRSCLDENSIYKDVSHNEVYCKCGTRKDYVYKAVSWSNCSNIPEIEWCEIEEEKSYDVYLSWTVVYNEKDKKILWDTYNQKCWTYDMKTHKREIVYLPIVTWNDNKLVWYLKCPNTVNWWPAYIYQDGTHSKIN